jgi:hypothetical protein
METTQATVYSYDNHTAEEWAAFIAAMTSGAVVEIDESMFDYWLDVLPPVFMNRTIEYKPRNSEEKVKRRVAFAFVEGADYITMFWSEYTPSGKDEPIPARHFCQCSNLISRGN